jgi:hypothetical protein
MKKVIPAVFLALMATLALQYGTGTAQGPVELGIDTDPAGNTATSLGPRGNCISVNADDTFDVDIFVSDVDDLVAWELYLSFDPSIIELVDANMDMFLASNPRSSLIRKSESVSAGRHFIGAADRNLVGESGSGVLARLTLHAKADGFSHIDIPSIDFDGDTDIDMGPRLTDSEGAAIADVTGDNVFDGPTYHALVAVNESCDAVPPTPTLPPSPTPPPGGGTTPSDTPPQDALPVPGDPTFEPPIDTSSPEGQSASSEASEEGEGTAADGSSEANGADEREASAAAAVAGEGTPTSGSSGDINLAPGGGSSSSSGGGLPLWAIGSIAAAVLVTAAGTSVYLAARAGGHYGR